MAEDFIENVNLSWPSRSFADMYFEILWSISSCYDFNVEFKALNLEILITAVHK